MRNFIITAFKAFWEIELFMGVTYGAFFQKVYSVYLILQLHGVQEGQTIALHGSKSNQWITIYIAGLLRGCKILVIPDTVKPSEARHSVYITTSKIVFTDSPKTMNSTMKSISLNRVDAMYFIDKDADEIHLLYASDGHKNLAGEIEFLLDNEYDIGMHELFELVEDFDDNHGGTITLTSGVEHVESKYVYVTNKALLATVRKSIKILPYDSHDSMYVVASTYNSHIMSVLLPFLKGISFVDDINQANIVFEDTNSFESLWRTSVGSLFERKWLNRILTIKKLRFFYEWLAKKLIYYYYNAGEKITAVILFNNTISYPLLDVAIKSKVPFYSTYGPQELCQFVAYNDYNDSDKLTPGCLGVFLPGTEVTIYQDILYLSTKAMFDRYWADERYTKSVFRHQGLYNTGDICTIPDYQDYVHIKGRYSRLLEVSEDDGYKQVQLDYLESHIRGLLYIKDALILRSKYNPNRLMLGVYPDVDMLDANGKDLRDFDFIVKKYVNSLNLFLNDYEKLYYNTFLTEDFARTHDGKIKACYYKLPD